MKSSPQRKAPQTSLAANFPAAATTSSLLPPSRNVSCANLSDYAVDATAAEGTETFDVGEYHLTSCPICLEHFTLDNPAILLKCEHGFHLQCLESWRQRSAVCPMCFTPLNGDAGRIMSPADARRRRRLRFKAPGDGSEAPERSVLIAAATSASGGGCEQSDCEGLHHTEVSVIEVTSADHDPHSWCGWLRTCCCFF